MTDEQAIAAVTRRRRRLIMVALEVMLGDLVAMLGIDGTRKILKGFLEQLDS